MRTFVAFLVGLMVIAVLTVLLATAAIEVVLHTLPNAKINNNQLIWER